MSQNLTSAEIKERYQFPADYPFESHAEGRLLRVFSPKADIPEAIEDLPGPLYHIYQVEFVATHLAEAIVEATGNNRDKFGFTIPTLSQIYAKTHDIGRAVDNEYHPLAGREIVKLFDLPQRGLKTAISLFTMGHHRFGLGWDRDSDHPNDPSYFRGTEFLAAIKQHIDPYAQNPFSSDIVQVYDYLGQVYGIAALCVLIADLSKNLLPGIHRYRPYPYSIDEGMLLIEQQIDRGNIIRNSERHEAETIGAYFVAGMINYLELRTGINYLDVKWQR